MVISNQRLREILSRINGKKIAVIGDIMLDRYLWGDAERISPEAPVPVVKLRREEIRIGGAANVADNVNVLGAEPMLISIIGDDDDGKKLAGRISELDMSPELLVVDMDRHTTVKTRVIARHQQVCRIDFEDSEYIAGKSLQGILDVFHSVAGDLDAVIISDYGKGLVSQKLVAEIVDFCRGTEIFIAVDPKEHHWKYYSGADLIKPNNHEAELATGIKIASEKSLEKAGWQFLKTTGAKAALITTGERGMSLFEPGKPVCHMPTMARDVYDVTGAGDTVIAVAASAIVGGASLVESAVIANHAAGVVVAEVGTAVAKPERIISAMTRERNRIESNETGLQNE